jgi:uncharacterized protein with FMN-binding domain
VKERDMTIKGWRAMLVAAVVGLAMWAGIAWAVVSMASAEDSTDTVVPCPTEDSCGVDYRDGAYHITPVVP